MISLSLPHIGVVEIWKVRLGVEKETERLAASCLSREECESAARFRFDYLRRRFIVRRAAYRHILSRYANIDPSRLEFAVNAFGKPSLSQVGIGHSTSHSGDLALLAVTADSPVGVDVEAVRDTGGRYEWLSPRERSEVEALPPPQRLAESLRLWTRKEAVAKALGVGISLLQPDMGVPFAEQHSEHDDRAADVWAVVDVGPFPGYVASVAVRGTEPSIISREWHPPT